MGFIAQFYMVVAAAGLVGITVMVIGWALRADTPAGTARRAGSALPARVLARGEKTSRSDTMR